MKTKLKRFGVFGDTASYEFDFFTKVAGSTSQCPMKMYFTNVSGRIVLPSEITGDSNTGWQEDPTQGNYDLIKSQDGAALVNTRSINGQTAQRMIEIDLTPLCNGVYGGSNSAMRTAVKGIYIDAWISGSGSNSGVPANGVRSRLWFESSSIWTPDGWTDTGSGNSSTLQKISSYTTAGNNKITSANKIYILITSQYSSNGTIPSAVSIDYLNIKLEFSRTPDNPPAIPVNLGDEWSIIVKGYSPAWDSTSIKNRRILEIFKSNTYRYILYYTYGQIKFNKYWIDMTGVELTSEQLVFNKYQILNVIICQTKSGMTMYQLFNNGAIKKYQNTNTEAVKGMLDILVGRYANVGFEADAFFDYITMIPKSFTDKEVEVILKGVLPEEIHYIQSFTAKQDFTPGLGYMSYATIILDSIGSIKKGDIVDIGPMELLSTGTVDSVEGNKINISTPGYQLTTLGNDQEVKIREISGYRLDANYSALAKKFENPNLMPLFNDSRWVKHVNSSVSIDGSALTTIATMSWHNSVIAIPVMPNNRYRLIYKKVESFSYMDLLYRYNNIVLKSDYVIGRYSTGEITYDFVTTDKTNNIYLALSNGTTIGTYTVSDVSLKRLD